MNNIKKVRIFLALMGIFLLSASCTGSSTSNQQIKLSIWGIFEDSDSMAPLIVAYQKLYPNVKITYTKKNIDTYESDLLNALASGSGPDLFVLHNDWLPKYQNKLTPATDKAFTLKNYQDTFIDVVNNDFVSGGKIYAAPLYVSSLGLYYNKDILGSNGIATPPKTWDELAADVKKISKADSKGFFYHSGVAMGTTSNINRAVDIMYLLMLQAGTAPYSSDHAQSTIDKAINDSSGNYFPGAKSLSYYTSFADPFSNNYSWNNSSNYSIDAFANGQLAFMFGYDFTRTTITSHSPNLNFDVAAVPEPNLTQNLVNFANYWAYAVSKQSKNAAWDWDFIKFMTSKTNQENYYKNNNVPSGRKDIIAEQTSDPVIGVFAASNLTAKSFYKADQVKVDQVITNMIDDVTLRNKQVGDALSNAAQQINLVSSGSGN